jgi:hypothetical protein
MLKLGLKWGKNYLRPQYSVPDKDPDPRIRTTGLRIRILLFFSVAVKMPTKFNFLLITYCRYIVQCTSVFKDSKLVRSHKTVEIKVCLNFFAC